MEYFNLSSFVILLLYAIVQFFTCVILLEEFCFHWTGENSNYWRKNSPWRCQQTFENETFVDITKQCFALLSLINFLPMI